MKANKRVIHHDCCATCMMHETDDEIDTYGSEYWFCLEDDNYDDDGYPAIRHRSDDVGEFRLKFFMVCDKYVQPPKSLKVLKANPTASEGAEE